jgi:ATP-dependent exoDNAse (exonuclease V) beta subunit
MSASWKHQQDWQREQEHNLLYVALTRAKQNLFIVGNADWCRNLDDVWDGHLRTCNAVIPDSLQQGDLALLLNLR